ncbi:VTT domain-containing protein [Mycobacterium sp. 1465703.0]|uniref:DedA family protein n=1 Tax=Mycobacterium sp. 1465703.0 TaxID=1834078 RepID=UPI0009F636A0
MPDPTHYLHLPNGPLVYLAVIAIVIASSLPVAALVVPAEPVLIATVLSMNAGTHSSIWVLLSLAIGASVAGDCLSYWLGRRFGAGLLATRWLRRYSRTVSRTRTAVRRRGVTLIITQKWIHPSRGFVPAIMGATRLRFRVFACFALIAATLWATAVVLGSHLGGIRLLNTMAVLAITYLIATVGRRCLLRRRAARNTRM